MTTIGKGSANASQSCSAKGDGSCSVTDNNPNGDRCIFPQCSGDGIEAGWGSSGWNGTATADAPTYEQITGGTYKYYFNVTNPGSPGISSGKKWRGWDRSFERR
jgi:hypothetical protein